MSTKLLKDMLNRANPQELADMLQFCGLGNLVRSMKTYLHATTPAANAFASQDSGAHACISLYLPDDAKAATILRATARGGTTTGEYAPQAYAASLTTGQVTVAASGDIQVLTADAPTGFDVFYEPDKYDVFLVSNVPVTSNAVALNTVFPTQFAQGIKFLMEATATAGTSTGQKFIQPPSASATTAGGARLNVAKNTVTFATADAVTTCTLKIALVPAFDLNAALEAATPF